MLGVYMSCHVVTQIKYFMNAKLTVSSAFYLMKDVLSGSLCLCREVLVRMEL